MRWGTALLLLALVSCTGDRAGVSQTFPVCPESVIEWGGQPSEELRALGVWWAAEGPEAIAFDVQVGTCGVGWLPSAELLATVPADAWEPVLNQPTLPVQTVVYADMDGSGGYTPAVDYVWGRGEGTALVFVPGVLREPSTMSPAFLPEPLSAVARKNLEPLLEREVFRPWSPRLEVSPGRMDCGRIVDVRACPAGPTTAYEGRPATVWVHPDVPRVEPSCSACEFVDVAPEVSLDGIWWCEEWADAVVMHQRTEIERIDGCTCTTEGAVAVWVVPNDQVPEAWWWCPETLSRQLSDREAAQYGLAP